MTTLGHSLMGLTIAVAVMPRRWTGCAKGALLLTFAALANVPDLKYVQGYAVRHSIFVNLALMAGPLLVLSRWAGLRRRMGGWPVVLGAAAAWSSHLLLDSFYSHGLGVPILWPISEGTLNLAMPWFQTLRYGWVPTARTAGILLRETVFYGSLLTVCAVTRWLIAPAPAGAAQGRTARQDR